MLIEKFRLHRFWHDKTQKRLWCEFFFIYFTATTAKIISVVLQNYYTLTANFMILMFRICILFRKYLGKCATFKTFKFMNSIFFIHCLAKYWPTILQNIRSTHRFYPGASCKMSEKLGHSADKGRIKWHSKSRIHNTKCINV